MISNKIKKLFFTDLRLALVLTLFLTLFNQGECSYAALHTKDEMPEILGIKEWRSIEGPLRKKNTLGSVVLVHFSSFTDLRSILKAETLINWQSKYFAYNFRVLHILVPDYSFEDKIIIPQYFVKQRPLNYTVALDAEKKQWQAYKNPAPLSDLLVDANGRIRFKVSPAESYAAQEQMIQTLLKEVNPEFEMELETYNKPFLPITRNYELGYRRAMNLGNSERLRTGAVQKFKFPKVEMQDNRIYLSGQWILQDEYMETGQGGAELKFRWDGAPLFLLAGIPRETPTPVEIRLDEPGLINKKNMGLDLVDQGNGYYVFLHENRIYGLLKNLKTGVRTLTLIFPEAQTRVYKLSSIERDK